MAHELELAKMIAAYYRQEIGREMQQAAHWARNGAPLAVHHRVMFADAYFQVVALMECEPSKGWDPPFDTIRKAIARGPLKEPGEYPPSPELHLYRNPVYVADLLRKARADGR